MQRITRSQSDRLLTGVCGGVADYFSIDPTVVRLIWIFFTLFGGSGLLAYIIATLLIPDSNSQEGYFKLDSLKSNPLWGVLFIFSGLILFLQYDDIFYLFWASFWGNFINISIAFVLLGISIYLLYNRQSQIKSINKNVLANPLHLSIDDKKLAGVCGGLGESLVIDPNIVRVLWVFGTFMSIGVGVLLYIILALILPEQIVATEDI
ncbi:MAG: PspC domain-containing protein [Candidatus Neomarinimicrobiota bacterium]|nr:PspC domain-containing protein [Candidatus Neomarinimicrobiota bacterium]